MALRYPKPAILERLGNGHGVIEASAGTGKTFTLEHLVVDLILKGIPLERILVVTFTVKATLELKARVRAKLEELVALEGDQAGAEGCCWELDEAALAALGAALSAFDRATIATIHGFCQQVLQDSAFEAGRQFSQKTVSAEAAFDTAFKTLIRTRLARGPEQILFERALDALGGVAGVGAFLQEAMKEAGNLELPDFDGMAAHLDTFPVATARALAADLQAAAGKGPRGALVAASGLPGGSFAKMGRTLEQLLRAVALGLGNPGLFWAETDLEAVDYVAKALLKGSGEVQALGRACEGLVAFAADFRAVVAAAFLPPLMDELARSKEQEGLFDFNDMIQLVHRAVLAPGGEALVQRLRERFQVALIDEFQDTDAQQWEIFQRLFLEAEGHRLILVGDPKQAIYGFRSGDLPTYLQAVAAVRARTGQAPEVLASNFRSTRELLEAYCELFQGAEGSAFFTGGNGSLWGGGVRCGKPALALTDGAGQPLPAIRVVEVEAGAAEGTRNDLAAGLAWAIQDTLRGAGAVFGAGERAAAVRPEEIFVLTRSASEGLLMARALGAAGVPHAFFKQDGLFDTEEAAAVRDLLLAIDAPLQESLRAKALLGPFFGLSFGETESCRELPETHPILRRLYAWRDLARGRRFGEFFARLVSDSGITQRLLFLEEGERTLTNIHHLLELLQGEALRRHCTLVDLAVLMQRWIDDLERPAVEDGDTQRLEREAGAVQILTMHKSKGLEAPVVAVFGGFSPGGAKAAIHRYHEPSGRRRAWVGSLSGAPAEVREWAEAEAVEEGERLLYVALTRAKAQLILPRVVLNAPLKGNSIFRKDTGDPKGPYGCVNRRLRAMLDLPVVNPRLRRDTVPAEPVAEPAPPGERLGQWQPRLPAEPALPDFRALAQAGRPLWTFSYTSLEHGLKGHRSGPEDWEERSEPRAAEGAGPAGGARLGTLVHELLQRLPLDSFQERTQAQWQAEPGIQQLLQAIPADAVKDVAAWAYQAFAQPLALPGGGAAVLAQAQPLLRELDFLTPYPGGRDLLTGSMDVLFQWQGKAYVLDWKTNRLPAYDPASLDRKVREDFLIQVQAYTLTACRFLGLAGEAEFEARFGGVLYVFLRGLPEGGVWTLKPSWAEVQAWTAELAALPVAALIPLAAGGTRHG